MSMRKTITTAAILLTASLSACTWVKLTDTGKNVDVRRTTGVGNCKSLGTLSVSGIDKITGISRNKGKVESELLTQARNDAAAMGANVIVPLEQPVDGNQQFKMYNCP